MQPNAIQASPGDDSDNFATIALVEENAARHSDVIARSIPALQLPAEFSILDLVFAVTVESMAGVDMEIVAVCGQRPRMKWSDFDRMPQLGGSSAG